MCSAGIAPSRPPAAIAAPRAAPTNGAWRSRSFTTPWRRRRPEPPVHVSFPIMIKLCDINQAAKEKLPPASPDKSGIGVHYVDAFIAPMNAALPDNTRVSWKRKGLRVTLRVGAKKGDGLMRRLAVSRDPVVMLEAALQEAAQAAGVQLQITATEILVTP